MKSVKEIYEFFLQYLSGEKKSVSLLDFLETIPGFNKPDEKRIGMSKMDMSLAMEYLHLCEKMCNDLLLIKVQDASIIKIDPHYIAVHEVNTSNPEMFMHELDYGLYDFKYRGFEYTRSVFENSVLPIVGKKRITGDEDMGTCFYIGHNMFVTAAHCIENLSCFNVLLPDNSPMELTEVWYAKDENHKEFDLAILMAKDVATTMKAFEMRDPIVLDHILTMGYPLIPGLNPIQIAESASIASYVKSKQLSSIGQVVANADSFLSKMDFFVISARVKGGNSGCPVINSEGYVVGVVFQIPFDDQGSSEGGRYDLMGYGVCLPSKYINHIIDNPESHQLVLKGGFYYEYPL